MTDLIKQNCKHFWVHDHMGYAKKCNKCGKMVRINLGSGSFLGRKIEEDHCSDIINHVSPLTQVYDK